MKKSVGKKNSQQAVWSELKTGLFGSIVTVCLASACTVAQEAAHATSVSPEQQKRLELMRSQGTEASLTILPVRLGGKQLGPGIAESRGFRDRVTEVVGVFLEMMGLKNIELGKAAFDPAAKTDMAGLAAALAQFVEQHPIATEYVLYVEFQTDGMSAIVADKTGALVWSDRLTAQDEPFTGKRGPPEPMAVVALLVKRLSPQLGLNEKTRKAARPGKMAAIMAQRGGQPPENETAPLPGRQKEMKKAMPNATLVVFSPRVRAAGKATEAGNAADLAKAIHDAGLCKAEPAKESLLLKASQADPNEMKVMWDLAREFRDHARKNRASADYVLYADYGFNPQHWQQGFVHFVVCDRKGEWVIVDMQNSHHRDYQSVKPTSKEDCDKILLNRLERYLR